MRRVGYHDNNHSQTITFQCITIQGYYSLRHKVNDFELTRGMENARYLYYNTNHIFEFSISNDFIPKPLVPPWIQ